VNICETKIRETKICAVKTCETPRRPQERSDRIPRVCR
jgi:hypothetical protein